MKAGLYLEVRPGFFCGWLGWEKRKERERKEIRAADTEIGIPRGKH